MSNSSSTDRPDRSNFSIDVAGADLAAAAQRLADYHTQRVDWWIAEEGRANDELQTHGIEIKEYQQTGGNRLEAQLHPTLARRLQECQDKLKNHRIQRGDYAQWAAFFGARDLLSWPVSWADFRYFDLGSTIDVETDEAVSAS